jgi:hypothetical protein
MDYLFEIVRSRRDADAHTCCGIGCDVWWCGMWPHTEEVVQGGRALSSQLQGRSLDQLEWLHSRVRPRTSVSPQGSPEIPHEQRD